MLGQVILIFMLTAFLFIVFVIMGYHFELKANAYENRVEYSVIYGKNYGVTTVSSNAVKSFIARRLSKILYTTAGALVLLVFGFLIVIKSI